MVVAEIEGDDDVEKRESKDYGSNDHVGLRDRFILIRRRDEWPPGLEAGDVPELIAHTHGMRRSRVSTKNERMNRKPTDSNVSAAWNVR